MESTCEYTKCSFLYNNANYLLKFVALGYVGKDGGRRIQGYGGKREEKQDSQGNGKRKKWEMIFRDDLEMYLQ